VVDLARAICTGEDWHGHKTRQEIVPCLAARTVRETGTTSRGPSRVGWVYDWIGQDCSARGTGVRDGIG